MYAAVFTPSYADWYEGVKFYTAIERRFSGHNIRNPTTFINFAT